MNLPTPYYDHKGITIYHGDCRDILPHLAPVDLVLTDPPYGMNWRSNSRRKLDKYKPIVGDDGSLDVVGILNLCMKALRPSHHIYVFGDFDLSPLPVGGTTELIWDKGRTSGGNLELPWGVAHEKIQFATKKNGAPNCGRLAARMRKGSVITCQRIDGNNSVHPTEKPIRLLRELIESSSCIGETVFDPFMGSGSTLEAARVEGRNAIGIEIEEKYCEIAAKRLAQEVLF